MIQHLFRIIWNERGNNIAVWVELFLISVFLWYVVDYIYVGVSDYYKPLGFDTEHTYIMHLGYLNSDSPLYQLPDSTINTADQLFMVLERIQQNQMIETASISVFSSPHIGSNSWQNLYCDTTRYKYYSLRRIVTPDFFRVFNYKSANGSTNELVETLKKNELVLAPEIEKEMFPGESAIGKRIKFDSDPDIESFRVGAISTTIRYDNWINESLKRYYAKILDSEYLSYYGNDNVEDLEFCVRVKPEEDYDFAERFYEQMANRLQIGNFYLNTIEYIPDNKAKFHMSMMNELKTRGFIVFFLLVNIFLGIIGTFWFRTQYRQGEIGVRVAMGDSPRGILRMYYSEGILLLSLAMIPAMVIIYILKETEILSYYWKFTVARYFIGLGITYLLLAGMIILGIWFPARKAVNMPPAEALRDE
ncbi:MAG: hypothetical protein BGO34_13075 [Bacteroidia bacterium 44-10]|nr:MAG: hypothetical protein BGO34_13075 [Bacteroidia bacterium 44-10]